LSSPTSGALAGILIFQDRSIPTGSSASTVDTSTEEVYVGALYFPSTTLIYKGMTGGGVGGGSIAIRSPTLLVAWKINVTGNVAFNNTYIPALGGSPIHSSVLVQ